MRRRFVLLVLLAVLVVAQAEGANLLRNPSFEDTPCTTPCNQGQAFMPSEWLALNSTPDTYSNDGSYGMSPGTFGNFSGATAQDGIRFVAGWSLAPEIFGQVLTTPLTPGQEYTLTGYIRMATRPDLARPGTYRVELWSSTSVFSSKVIVGTLSPHILNLDVWEQRTLTFIAPAQAATHNVFVLVPIGSVTGGSYPGLDNLVLESPVTDSDGDGLPDDADNCPSSDLGGTIVIDGCDTGVANDLTGDGCTLSDLLAACGTSTANHGDYVSCVAHLTNTWKDSGLITGQEKGKIQNCAAKADIP